MGRRPQSFFQVQVGDQLPTPPPPLGWCTYIPDRTPQFKMHSGIGMAKNSINQTYRERRTGEDLMRGGIIYQLVHTSSESTWVVVAVIEPGSRYEDNPVLADKKFKPGYMILELPG